VYIKIGVHEAIDRIDGWFQNTSEEIKTKGEIVRRWDKCFQMWGMIMMVEGVAETCGRL
jgi:hypothetical protein